MPTILLTVQGTPRPQPRPRFGRGRVVSTASPLARRWIANVEAEARKAAASHGKQTGAVRVDLMFLMPTSQASRHGLPHTFVPDADNLAKLALDSIMRAGLIGDDKSVSSLSVSKTWAKAGALACVIQPDQREPATPPDPARPDWI